MATRTKDKRDKCKFDRYSCLLTKETYPLSLKFGIKASRDTQLKVLTLVGTLLEEELLTNRDGFKLPYNLGFLKIAGEPIVVRRRIKLADYLASDGYFYNLFWLYKTKISLVKRTIKQYKFVPSVAFRKSIIKLIRDDKFSHFEQFQTHKALKNVYKKKSYRSFT